MPVNKETQAQLLRKVIDKLQQGQDLDVKNSNHIADTTLNANQKVADRIDELRKTLMGESAQDRKDDQKGKGDAAEDARENRNLLTKIGNNLSGLAQGASNVAAAPGNLLGQLGDKVKGFSSSIMGLMKGAGSFILPIVAVAGLMGTGFFDAEKFKTNVLTILSIGQEVGAADLVTLVAFKPAMTALSKGLLAFGVGSAVGGGVEAALDYFGAGDWASKIKNNVLTLLSIGQEVGLAKIVTLLAFEKAMIALGVGLAAFGLGEGIAGVAQLTGFSADKLKDNVLTLLSIGEEVGLSDIGTLLAFAPAMTALGVGIAAFGIGEGIAGVGQLLSFDADKLKATVLTLLSIPEGFSEGSLGMLKEGGAVVLALTGLGLGLAAFGVGTVITAIAQFFSKDDFAEKTKQNVLTLLSIGDVHPDADVKAAKVKDAMTSLSGGLALFSGGTFISALADAGAKILNFITGGESPIDQLLKLADRDQEIASTERNITKMVNALQRFSSLNLTGPTINFAELIAGVGEAIPFIQALGGTHPKQLAGEPVELGGGWISGGVEFGPKGILDEGLKIDEVSAKIAQVQGALGYNVNVSPTGSSPAISMGSQVTEMSNEQAGTQAPVVVNQVDASVTDASVKSSSSNAIVGDPSPAIDTLGGNRLEYA